MVPPIRVAKLLQAELVNARYVCFPYQEIMGNDIKKQTKLEFDYEIEHGNNMKVAIMVSSRGNIWVLSMAPEEVVDYLFLRIKEIKGL